MRTKSQHDSGPRATGAGKAEKGVNIEDIENSVAIIKKDLQFLKESLESMSRKIKKQGSHFELGSNRSICGRLLKEIKELKKVAKKLKKNFYLENVYVPKAYSYLYILGNLEVLEESVDTIYKSRYGTLKNTQDTLEKIQASYDAVNALLTYYE